MGGQASFLDSTKTYPMFTEDGRALYTTLNGKSLIQKIDENGNSLFDEFGEPLYEYADGSGDYNGFAEIFEMRGLQTQDEEGNLLFADADGNSVTQIVDDDGNIKYVTADGNELDVTKTTEENGEIKFLYTDADGKEQSLSRQLTKYDTASEIAELNEDMNNLMEDIKDGKYPKGNEA